MTRHLFIFGLLCLASCASAKLEPTPVKDGMAQIVVKRMGSYVLLGTVFASVEVNGTAAARLGPDEIYTADLPAGKTSIAVSGDLMPGRYVINFEAIAGKTYRFAVEPRGDSLGKIPSEFIPSEAGGSFHLRPFSG